MLVAVEVPMWFCGDLLFKEVVMWRLLVMITMVS